MKPIFHIVRKDLLFLRWLLLVWLLLCLGNVLLGLHYVIGPQRGLLDIYVEGFINAFRLVSGFISYIAVLFLFRQDPLLGTDIAWITRPISAGQLFAAKFISILVLCLAPCVVGIPWWLYCGADILGVLNQCLGTFLASFAGCFFALPVALFTMRNRESSRRNIFLGGALTILGVFSLVLLVNRDSFDALDTNMKTSRGSTALMFAVLFVGLMCWSQFRTRNWKLTLSLGVCGWALVLLTMHAWNWNWRRGFSVDPSPAGNPITLRGFDAKRDAGASLGRVGFSFRQPFSDKICRIRFEEGVWKQLGMALPLSGMLVGESNAQGELLAARQLASGKALDLGGRTVNDLFALKTPDAEQLSKLLQDQARNPRAAGSAELDLSLLYYITEPRVLARIPLKEGSIWSSDNFRLSLESFEKLDASIKLRIRSFNVGNDRILVMLHDPVTGWTSTTDARQLRRSIFGADAVIGVMRTSLESWPVYKEAQLGSKREVLLARDVLERLELVVIAQKQTAICRARITGQVEQVPILR